MKTAAVSALIALLAYGCSVNCIQATGPATEKAVEVAPFTAIEAGGATQVTIEKGPALHVSVTAAPEVIALLETNVSGGRWKIRTSKCWSSKAGLAIHITTPEPMESIEASGSADIRTSNVFGTEKLQLSSSGSSTINVSELNVKSLDMDLSGSSAITVRGTCGNMEGSISGSGDLHAVDLACNAAKIGISGSGNATVMVITSLDASVSGAGVLRYNGRPDVRSSISGSGSVTPLP